MRVRAHPSGPFRAVTFDAAGTLFHLAESVGDTYARFGRIHGRPLSPLSLNRGFRSAWSKAPALDLMPFNPSETPPQRERRWWKELVDSTFSQASNLEGAPTPPRFEVPPSLFDALYSHYETSRAWKLYPETLEVLTAFEERGTPLGIVSNFDARLHQVLSGFQIASFFETVILSGEIGTAKPAKAIFEAAAEALTTPSSDILHVGDDPRADWKGAREAGLQVFELARPDLSLEDIPMPELQE